MTQDTSKVALDVLTAVVSYRAVIHADMVIPGDRQRMFDAADAILAALDLDAIRFRQGGA